MQRAESPQPPASGGINDLVVALASAVSAFLDSDTRHAHLIDCVELNNEGAK